MNLRDNLRPTKMAVRMPLTWTSCSSPLPAIDVTGMEHRRMKAITKEFNTEYEDGRHATSCPRPKQIIRPFSDLIGADLDQDENHENVQAVELVVMKASMQHRLNPARRPYRRLSPPRFLHNLGRCFLTSVAQVAIQCYFLA